MLEYIEEGEPLKLPLPDRRVSTYVQSHFYLDEFPQSTEPLDENARAHTQLGARLEDDYTTDSEGPDEAFRRDGFDAPLPLPAAPSSSISSRLGEAVLRGGEAIIAAAATGVGQAVERFGFRNAELAAAQVEQRVLPRIIGRCADAEQLIVRAGGLPPKTWRPLQRNRLPLLAEAGTQTAGGGILEGLAAAGGAAAEGAGAEYAV